MKKNPWIIIVILLVIVVAFWLVSTILKKKQNKANPAKSTSGAGTSGQVSTSVQSHGTANETTIFPLKRGSNNEAVKYLKMAINYISAKKGAPANLILTTEANVFGQATENALYKLYGQRVVDKALAKRMSDDADLPEFTNYINYLK